MKVFSVSSNKMNQRGLLDSYLYLKKTSSFFPLSCHYSMVVRTFSSTSFLSFYEAESKTITVTSFLFVSSKPWRKVIHRGVYEKNIVTDRHVMQRKNITYSFDFLFFSQEKYISTKKYIKRVNTPYSDKWIFFVYNYISIE